MKQQLKKFLSSALACAIVLSSLANAIPVLAANGITADGPARISGDALGNLSLGQTEGVAPLEIVNPEDISETPTDLSLQELGNSGAAAAEKALESATPVSEGEAPSVYSRTEPSIGDRFVTPKPVDGTEVHAQAGKTSASALNELNAVKAENFSETAVNGLYGDANKGAAETLAANAASSGLNILHPSGRFPRHVEESLRAQGYELLPQTPSINMAELARGAERAKMARRPKADSAPFTPITIDEVNINNFNINTAAGMKAAMTAIETALYKRVDADPSGFNASNPFGYAPSTRMGRIHVQYVANIDGAPSIHAVFRQWETGTENDGSEYLAAVSGAAMRFDIKVYNGIPTIMDYQGALAPIDPQILSSQFSSDPMDPKLIQLVQSQLAASAHQQQPQLRRRRSPYMNPHQNNILGKANSQIKAAQDSPITFQGRQISLTLDDPNNPKSPSSWHVFNIYQYQAKDSTGKDVEAMIIVDVHTGKASVVSEDDLHYFKNYRKRSITEDAPATDKKAKSRKIGQLVAHYLAKNLAKPAASADDEAGSITGIVMGKGNGISDGLDNDPVESMPMAFANVYNADTGEVVATTDADGKFTIPASITKGKPMNLRVGTSGQWAPVKDADTTDPDLSISLTATPGKPTVFLLNPDGDNEQLNAMINAFVDVYGLFNWLKTQLAKRGINDPRIDRAISAIFVNSTIMIGNAFYNPADLSLNLMKPGKMMQKAKVKGKNGRIEIHDIAIYPEGTSQQSIDKHEAGHSYEAVTGQFDLSDLTEEQVASTKYQYVRHVVDSITGEDGNESLLADGISVLSRFSEIISAETVDVLSTAGIIGNGFITRIVDETTGEDLKLPDPNVIRDANEITPYNYDPNDPKSDPHQIAGVGTIFKVVLATLASLSAQGTLTLEMKQAALDLGVDLFIVGLYNKPAAIPNGLYTMMVDRMRADGSNPVGALIKAIAAKYGMGLPDAPPPPTVNGPVANQTADASNPRSRTKRQKKRRPRRA